MSEVFAGITGNKGSRHAQLVAENAKRQLDALTEKSSKPIATAEQSRDFFEDTMKDVRL